MRVFVKGQGEVSLSKTDFVGSGGEGSVYAKGSQGFKIYHDPTRVIPFSKITELAAITDPCVNKPEKMLLDKKGKPIGYTMAFLKDMHVLCQLFPPVFRTRNNISPQQMVDLVRKLQQRVTNVHQAGVLIVDLNEMNFLVDHGFTDVYAIDVDSYQTAHHPATAIMPSVRDHQVQGLDWTENSDWFSFACIAFNMFCGIHPYKGRHSSIKGLEDRMKAGVSVFNADVRVPKVVLPFDVIPDIYRQWFKAVLEGGRRLPPPTTLHGVIVVTPVVRLIQGTDKLDIADWFTYAGQVLGLWDNDGRTLTWTDEGLYIDNRRVHGKVAGISGVGFSPKMATPVVAGHSGGKLKLLDATSGTEIPVNLGAAAVMSHRGTIYLRNRDKLLEVVLTDLGNSKVIASTRPAGTCLEHATRLYPGVAVQNLLDSTWATLFPKPGFTYNVALRELDKYRVIDAKFDGPATGDKAGVLMVVAEKGGKYDRLVFRFDADFKTYDLRKVEDITPAGLNFVVLDAGVCVCMTEDETLELFSIRKGRQDVKVVDDPVLGGDMHLAAQGGRVVFTRGNRVQTMRMK